MKRALLIALAVVGLLGAGESFTGGSINAPTGFVAACPSGLCSLNIPSSNLTTWYPATQAEANYTSSLSYPRYDVTCTGAACGVGGIDGWDQAPKQGGGTLSSAGCSSVGTTTPQNVNCMIANVAASQGAGIRFVFPNQTYTISATGNVIKLRTNWVVLEGITGARLNVTYDGQGFLGATGCLASGFTGEAGASAISICQTNHSGTGVTWSSGFDEGNTVIGVSSTAGFTVGQYAMGYVSKSPCTLLTHPTTGFSKITWLDKVTAIDPGVSITIERGIPVSLPTGCRTSPLIEPKNGVTGVGVDNFDIYFTGVPKTLSAFNPAISIAGSATDVFVVNSLLSDFDNLTISVAYSRGVWIRGNTTQNIVHNVSFDTTNFQLREGATDFVVEDNACLTSAVCYQARGPSRGVVAYNYARMDGAPSPGPERALILHGNYVSNVLFEGNDVDQFILMYDEFWGTHGPHNTAFRNRNIDAETAGGQIIGGDGSGSTPWSDPETAKNVMVTLGSAVDTVAETITKTAHGLVDDEWLQLTNSGTGNPPGGLTDNGFYYVVGATTNTFQLSTTQGGGPVNLTSQGTDVTRFSVNPNGVYGPLNLIANTAACYAMNAGNCSGAISFNRNLNSDFWAEKNVAHTRQKYTTKSLSGFGTSLGETQPGDNEVRNTPHSEASSPYPNTLYRARDAYPTWWCREACSWDYDGIGAFGDDFTGTLCKLPAQIRAEAGICTPL